MTLPALPKAGAPVTAEGVAKIEAQVAQRIADIDDFELLQEWRDQAAALEAYLRSKGLQRPMLGAQRRVEARIGQLIGDPRPGTRTDLQPLTHEQEVMRQPRDAHDFRILAHALSRHQILTNDEWRKSRRALVSFLRQKLGLIPETPPLPDGEFRCIVADPPWKVDTGPNVFNGTVESGHDALDYERLSVESVAAFPVKERGAPDAHLYLWTTNRYLESAYHVARAWGFKPSVVIVWAKTPRGIGLGDAFRLTTEFCLYARRGVLKEKRIVETTWFNWPRGKHSEKPEAFYELVESVSHAPYLEMFARRAREGWTVWGDEAPVTTPSHHIDGVLHADA